MTSNLHNSRHVTSQNWEEDTSYSSRFHRQSVTEVNDYTAYHKYAVEYSPSKIIYYIDDKIFKIENNPFEYNLDKIIILGLGMSHYVNWNGPSPQYYKHPDDSLPAPNYFDSTNFNNTSMAIKYVKYYRMDMTHCNTINYIIDSNTAFNNYDNKVKKSIKIRNNVIASSLSPKVIIASDSILIDGEFEIPLEQEMYMDVNACY